jgi:hypothetical protein
MALRKKWKRSSGSLPIFEFKFGCHRFITQTIVEGTVKRRDLLKGAGTLVLGAPAVRAAALLKSNAQPTPQIPIQPKDLVLAFNGPFCFWQGIPPGSSNPDCEQQHCITVMAPPVGPDCPDHKIRHQPWVGTTTNEIAINANKVPPGTTLKLAIDVYSLPQAPPAYSGTPCFPYAKGTDVGAKPLFNLAVPIPDIIIGVRPTAVMMVCINSNENYCTQYMVWGSGLSFVYKKTPLDGVDIKVQTKDGFAPFFKPCFFNDADLKDATLGVHLTALDRNPDKEHKHAQMVWQKMLSMYPWMAQEITNIDFCPFFDPASCDPLQCTTSSSKPALKKGKSEHTDPILFGPGSDCEVPVMGLGLPGLESHSKRKS